MKITIITGSSSGMGKEFALQLSKKFQDDKNSSEKRQMWLFARNGDALSQLKSEIENRTSDSDLLSVKIFPVDLEGRSGINSFTGILKSENKAFNLSENSKDEDFTIEYLINNAGFGVYGPFEENPIEKNLSMIDLNCTTVTGLCYSSLPYLKFGSTIINVASLASFLPLGNFSVYGATKSFALNFTIALAAELKDKGIKVCALCPGPVSTNFANVASNGAREKVKHGLPADKVVAHCLKKASKGKHIILYAAKWKFKAFMSSFVPRFSGAEFTYKYCKRPYRHKQ